METVKQWSEREWFRIRPASCSSSGQSCPLWSNDHCYSPHFQNRKLKRSGGITRYISVAGIVLPDSIICHDEEDCLDENGKKLILTTESRAAQSVELYLTMDKQGEWSAKSSDTLRKERKHKKTVDNLNSRRRETYEQLVLSATEGVTAKGLALVVNFDGGDVERKACASLEQLVKSKLAKKKEFSYQGSGGRGIVFTMPLSRMWRF